MANYRPPTCTWRALGHRPSVSLRREVYGSKPAYPLRPAPERRSVPRAPMVLRCLKACRYAKTTKRRVVPNKVHWHHAVIVDTGSSFMITGLRSANGVLVQNGVSSLRPAAEVFGEEPVGVVVKVEAVLGLDQSVTLVLVHHVLMINPTLRHGRNDLL